MPPWHADPKVGAFLNDPRLTDSEIATIDAWVRIGTPEGDAKDLPPPPVFAQSPTGQKPGKKSATPSFLNQSALPAQGADGGGKQLVGQ